MTSNGKNINVETKTIEWTNNKIAFNTYRIYATIYYTYLLLYCKGHIQIISNESTTNVKKIE